MTGTLEIDKAIEWLLPYYTQMSELNTSSLNTGLRKSLRLLAAQHMLQFKQDNIGNIYIGNLGRDPELLPIGICFPLDSCISPAAFQGALRAFLAVQGCNLTCGISLVGWSSPNGKLLGHDVWAGRSAVDELFPVYPDLEQFALMTDVAEFPMSALFETIESDSNSIAMRGSPVLVHKVIEASIGMALSTSAIMASSRSPEIRIEGKLAVPVTVSALRMYSSYVQALFANFD